MPKNSRTLASSSDKRRRNAQDYQSSKSKQDHILLRLDKGDRARLDSACSTVGLSRAAFAKLYLLPLTDALAPKLHDIEKARTAQHISLPTFFERAIEQALVPIDDAPPPATVAHEFDALFGPPGGDA